MFSFMNVAPAISPSVQSVLDLFATDLADVRFADVDGQTLARVAADVQAAAEAVSAAQAALDSARAALQERQEMLLQHAQRALAYARVYAESDPVLAPRLEAISLPRPVRRLREPGEVLVLSAEVDPAPRRRGRPRKENPLESSLTMTEHMSADSTDDPPLAAASSL
jgi:hypothetical protein